MELLITKEQVAGMAFCAPDFISPDAIPEATILAAQQKFVRPVLGALYDRLLAGSYRDFLAEYILPPLALYVKMLMLPSLAVQAGTAGVVEVTSKNLVRAGDGKLRAAVRRLRGDASALMRRAVEYIEAHPTSLPGYDPREDISRRCSTTGGVILDKDE